MTDSELRWVTDHMGHTLDVHKRWYRKSNNTVELSKVASVLLAAESGSLQKAFSVPFDDILSTGKPFTALLLPKFSEVKSMFSFLLTKIE